MGEARNEIGGKKKRKRKKQAGNEETIIERGGSLRRGKKRRDGARRGKKIPFKLNVILEKSRKEKRVECWRRNQGISGD